MWFHLNQKQTKQIKEKQTSVMAELAKVEPAVQEAKMGKLSFLTLGLEANVTNTDKAWL